MLAVKSNRGRAQWEEPCAGEGALQRRVLVSTEKVVEKLTAAILDLVDLYCSTFNANFQTTQQSPCRSIPVQEAGSLTTLLLFNVYAAHRIPITWATR